MLFLSPHQPDDIPKLLGTFSLEATYHSDPLSSGKPINGVTINMLFDTLDGEEQGAGTSHGATVNAGTIKKIVAALGQLGPYIYDALASGKWSVAEDSQGNLTYTRIE